MVASLLLVVALYPCLLGLAGSSDFAASESVATGLSGAINALLPGMTVTLEVTSLPPGSTIAISTGSLLVTSGAASTRVPLRFLAPSLTLSPGASYSFSLSGSTVQVNASV